jgi:hypothetical protein
MFILFTVLWQPRKSFLKLPETRVSWLVGAFIAIELLLSLTLVRFYMTNMVKAAASNPAITASMYPYMTAFSMVFSSLVNIFIIGVTAFIFLLIIKILGGSVKYRSIVGMLVIASAPILLGHAIRNFAYLGGYLTDLTDGILSLQNLAPPVQSPAIAKALKVFDVFDVWTMCLVILGFSLVSGLKRLPAIVTSFVLWGALQMLLMRITLAASGQ